MKFTEQKLEAKLSSTLSERYNCCVENLHQELEIPSQGLDTHLLVA
jgi:hypothetical protein